MEIYKVESFSYELKFYFPTATYIIIKVNGIIEETNIKNNSLCITHIA